MEQKKKTIGPKKATPIIPKGIRVRQEAPQYDAVAASSRYVLLLFWLVAFGVLINVGQAIRWHDRVLQLSEIKKELQQQYRSVLGDNVGNEPFGRLQFEHDKLATIRQRGLDPLAVMAALSTHADAMLRIDSMNLAQDGGSIVGMYMPDRQAFTKFIAALGQDEKYLFTLLGSEDVFGGIQFRLRVVRQ